MADFGRNNATVVNFRSTVQSPKIFKIRKDQDIITNKDGSILLGSVLSTNILRFYQIFDPIKLKTRLIHGPISLKVTSPK